MTKFRLAPANKWTLIQRKHMKACSKDKKEVKCHSSTTTHFCTSLHICQREYVVNNMLQLQDRNWKSLEWDPLSLVVKEQATVAAVGLRLAVVLSHPQDTSYMQRLPAFSSQTGTFPFSLVFFKIFSWKSDLHEQDQKQWLSRIVRWHRETERKLAN